jgi:hypothetical protein
MLETALAEEVAAHAATTVDLSMAKQELLKGAASHEGGWGIAAGSPTVQVCGPMQLSPPLHALTCENRLTTRQRVTQGMM